MAGLNLEGFWNERCFLLSPFLGNFILFYLCGENIGNKLASAVVVELLGKVYNVVRKYYVGGGCL